MRNALSRRSFLRTVTGAAVLPLLSACVPAVPATSTPAAAAGVGKVKLPTYAALPNLPPPDLPGTPDGLLAPGYQKYPSNLIRSVAQPPGKGGDLNALT